MTDWIIDRIIEALEKRLAVSVDYLRQVAASSRGAFLKFMLFMPLARHRGGLEPAAHHVAGLTATLNQDCGTCAQIAINEALRNAIPVTWIKAVLTGCPDQLPPALRDVYHYTQAVVERREDTAGRRDRVREHVGEEGLVALALAIAAAQVFPVLKRGLGHDVSCRLIDFDLGDVQNGRNTDLEQPPVRRDHV